MVVGHLKCEKHGDDDLGQMVIGNRYCLHIYERAIAEVFFFGKYTPCRS